MGKSHLLTMAQQGDQEAIATLINKNLQPRGITAKCAMTSGYLRIFLEGAQVPNQKGLVPFIHQGIQRLNIENLRLARVFGQKKGTKHLAWHQQLDLAPGGASLDSQPLPLPQLKALAQQGDTEALNYLLNQDLHHKLVTIHTQWYHHPLQLTVTGEQKPDYQVTLTLIDRSLLKINSPLCRQVEVVTFKKGTEFQLWQKTFRVGDSQKQAFS